jgi:hypothetical protein
VTVGSRASLLAAIAVLGLGAGTSSACTHHRVAAPRATAAAVSQYNWRKFNVDAARSGVEPAATGITAANVAGLARTRVALPGTPDSSPIYLRGVTVGGTLHNVFFLTTTYGKTVAMSGAGTVLWTYTPPSYHTYAGTYQITTATPAADPSGKFIYAATPSGYIHKLRVSNGSEVTAGRWPVRVTTLPAREKIAASINLWNGRLYVTTGGYIGDQPPYQGHVVVISLATARKVGIWNSLCSSTHHLLRPSTCPQSDSAIFGRSGAVINLSRGRSRGDMLVATGNGFWNGRQYWGDSVLELSPLGARIRHSYTPKDQAQLNATDTDVGSTSPAVIRKRGPVIVQGGKDGKLRVVDMGAQGVGHLGGGLQTLSTPGSNELFTTPAVYTSGTREWVFVADDSGTDAYRVSGSGRSTRLRHIWGNGTSGTSPIVAGGLLYIFDPNGALNVYAPGTGHRLASLATGNGHWNSPIVADGEVVVPLGDANNHLTSGAVDIFHP